MLTSAFCAQAQAPWIPVLIPDSYNIFFCHINPVLNFKFIIFYPTWHNFHFSMHKATDFVWKRIKAMNFWNVLQASHVLLLSFIQRISRYIMQRISLEALTFLSSHLCRWVFNSWLFAKYLRSLWFELENICHGIVMEFMLKLHIVLLCSWSFAELLVLL